jgi:hypothetical protein
VDTSSAEVYEKLIRSAARRLKGHQRRLFQAEVAGALCGGSPRATERRFGFDRHAVTTGQHEARAGVRCVEDFPARGKLPCEVKDAQLAADVRSLVEPHTQADPELKSARRYTNLSAREVLEALKSRKGYAADRLPSERTMRDILNRLGYRLRRIQKAKPLKKLPETDAVFANVAAARKQYGGDPETLEVSIDTKAKVNEGDYSRGGKVSGGFTGADARGVGPRPAGQDEVDAVRRAGAARRGADAGVRQPGDERLLGGRLEAVVGVGQGRAGARQAAGDLPGQRAEERGQPDAVAGADDRVL